MIDAIDKAAVEHANRCTTCDTPLRGHSWWDFDTAKHFCGICYAKLIRSRADV